MKRTRVLVVDDERRYRDLLHLNLTASGYEVTAAANGLGALNAMERDAPDLVLLDIRLPDLDGYEICRRIREYSDVPIIMLTANAQEAQKVRGLRSGADDYITKPFGADELLARIDALLRRTQGMSRTRSNARRPYRHGKLAIDFEQRRVLLEGKVVDLTGGEYKLLEYLAENAGRVLVHDQLLRNVWGMGYESDVPLLHSAVRRVRDRLGESARKPRYLLTKHGLGYMLISPDPE
jgi:DNA-binding response OmpR family regulator